MASVVNENRFLVSLEFGDFETFVSSLSVTPGRWKVPNRNDSRLWWSCLFWSSSSRREWRTRDPSACSRRRKTGASTQLTLQLVLVSACIYSVSKLFLKIRLLSKSLVQNRYLTLKPITLRVSQRSRQIQQRRRFRWNGIKRTNSISVSKNFVYTIAESHWFAESYSLLDKVLG